MKLKICGMKYNENIQAVAKLRPDYLGFIFYDKSKRDFKGTIPPLPKSINKTGVFVDSSLEEVNERINEYDLYAVQLHGNESPEFCKSISNVEVIKVFSMDETFDFNQLKPFENVCDYFLFDTKGKEKGGNGVVFDWQLLKNYSLKKPYFLSGGIGLEEKESLISFSNGEESKYCYALDVNSKFEIEPGLKDIEKLIEFNKTLEKG